MLELRDYQLEALEALAKIDAQGSVRRSLVVHPTGAGKTVTFCHLLNQRPGRSIVLVHRDELVGQTIDKMALIAPHLVVGVVKAERDECDADIVVASVQTAHRPRRMQRLTGFDTVVVDEAHHASAPSWRAVLEHLGSFAEDGSAPLTVGFTATPERDKGTRLGHVWQQVAHYRSIREMIYAGYLVPVIGQRVATGVDFSHVRVSRGDFSEADLSEEMMRSGAIEAIAEAYSTYAKSRKGVAFTPTVVTAQALAGALCERGIPAEAVWGNMPTDERRAVLTRLRSGETRCVTNCAVLTEGFDEPTVDCIVVARPTKAHALYIQMVGRGLRTTPGKDDCLVLDVTGATERHDLVALVDLGLGTGSQGRKDTEEQERDDYHRCELCNRELATDLVVAGARRHPNCRARRTEKADLFATSKLRWLPVDGGHVLPAGKDVVVMAPSNGLWTLANYESGRIEILHRNLTVDWASGIGEDRAKAFGSLARRDARWLGEAPTQRQLSRLVREGLPENKVSAVATRGAAADLLTRIQGRRAMRKLTAMMMLEK